MSPIGTGNSRARRVSPDAEAAPAGTPYRLLWTAGIVVGVLSIVAFVLWGINGPGTLFDLLVALCT